MRSLFKRLRSNKKWLIGLVTLLILCAAGVTLAAVHFSRPSSKALGDEGPDMSMTDIINYSGTGDAEDNVASKSNKYICVAYQGKLPASAMLTAGQTALGDIESDIEPLSRQTSLYASGQAYQTALQSAQAASDQLNQAATVAKSDVNDCDLVGLLGSGSSQMKQLYTRLASRQATKADIIAAVKYDQALRSAGF